MSFNSKSKTVSVFCGADEKIPEEYKRITYELGAALAKNGYTLFSGGNMSGLMNEVNNGHAESGAQSARYAVIPEALRGLATPHPHVPLENIIWTPNVHNRVEAFYGVSENIIVLPGGYGTMHELMDCLVLSQFGVIKKRIILLNIDNFWDGILSQFKTMVAKKTLQQKHLDHLNVVHSIAQTIELLESTAELKLAQGFADEHWKVGK